MTSRAPRSLTLLHGVVGRSEELSFPWYQSLEEEYGLIVPHPGVHLPVGVPPLLRELVPRLGFAQQLADGPLGQAQHVLGEQSLADVVYGQHLSHPEHKTQNWKYFSSKFAMNFYGCLGYFPNDSKFTAKYLLEVINTENMR